MCVCVYIYTHVCHGGDDWQLGGRLSRRGETRGDVTRLAARLQAAPASATILTSPKSDTLTVQSSRSEEVISRFSGLMSRCCKAGAGTVCARVIAWHDFIAHTGFAYSFLVCTTDNCANCPGT